MNLSNKPASGQVQNNIHWMSLWKAQNGQNKTVFFRWHKNEEKQGSDDHNRQESGYLREEGRNCDCRGDCGGLLGCCQCPIFGQGGQYRDVVL